MTATYPNDLTQRRSRFGCLTGCMVLLLSLAAVAIAMAAGILLLARFSPFSAYSSMPVHIAITEFTDSAFAALGEDPAFNPAPPAQEYPIDRSVPQAYVVPIVKALDLMRGTPDGERLFQVLVDNDVTISVESMSYNAGYTYTQWTRRGWKESHIVVAKEAVRSRSIDVLAAIIVHEAAHADRAISEKACFYRDDCETLPNGVELDEELYAHGVEAQWWQEIYGDDGKRFATNAATGENALLDEYQKGSAAFRRYVRAIRGDTREGQGLAGDA